MHSWDALDDYWDQKGSTLLDLEEYEKALSSFNKALEINPNDADYWYWKGSTLHDLERHQEALSCLEQALEIDPEHNLAKTLLNLIQLEQEVLLLEIQQLKQTLAKYTTDI